MMRRIIVELIALLFVILFLHTGIDKLREYDIFTEQIAESALLGPISGTIAWALPVTEFSVAILLFLPWTRRLGLYGALVLMSTFTVYIIAILSFSDEIPCSCGGLIGQLSWTAHILFNSALIILSVGAIILDKKTNPSNRVSQNRLSF